MLVFPHWVLRDSKASASDILARAEALSVAPSFVSPSRPVVSIDTGNIVQLCQQLMQARQP